MAGTLFFPVLYCKQISIRHVLTHSGMTVSLEASPR